MNQTTNSNSALAEPKNSSSMLSPIRDALKHSTFKQRVILFVSSEGGVGKTTLAVNFANWFTSGNANGLYIELLGGSGIDNLIKSKSTRIEDIFNGIAEPFLTPVANRKIAYVSSYDPTTGSLSQFSMWQRFWDNYIAIDNKTKTMFDIVVINTMSYMLSTRYLASLVTDIVVVTDMRETKEAFVKSTIKDLMASVKSGNNKDVKFHVVTNFFKENQDNDERYKKTRSEIDAIAESYEIPIRHIKIPWIPSVFGSIILQGKERNTILKNLILALYPSNWKYKTDNV